MRACGSPRRALAPVPVGTSFYIILRGSVQILHHPLRSSPSEGLSTAGVGGAVVTSRQERDAIGAKVGVLTAGMVVGELSACGDERDSSAIALGTDLEKETDDVAFDDGFPPAATVLLQVDAQGVPPSSLTPCAWFALLLTRCWRTCAQHTARLRPTSCLGLGTASPRPCAT